MSVDKPSKQERTYHRQWKQMKRNDVLLALSFLGLILLPLVSGLIGTLLGAIAGSIVAINSGFKAGFGVGIFVVIAFVFLGLLIDAIFLIGDMCNMSFGFKSFDNRREEKRRALALQSLESSICPSCGIDAAADDRNEFGQWICSTCRASFSTEGKYKQLSK